MVGILTNLPYLTFIGYIDVELPFYLSAVTLIQ